MVGGEQLIQPMQHFLHHDRVTRRLRLDRRERHPNVAQIGLCRIRYIAGLLTWPLAVQYRLNGWRNSVRSSWRPSGLVSS